MRSVRRLIGAAVLLGAGVGVLGAAPSADAYCGHEILALDDGSGGGGNGCSNPCPDPPAILTKYGIDWQCLE